MRLLVPMALTVALACGPDSAENASARCDADRSCGAGFCYRGFCIADRPTQPSSTPSVTPPQDGPETFGDAALAEPAPNDGAQSMEPAAGGEPNENPPSSPPSDSSAPDIATGDGGMLVEDAEVVRAEPADDGGAPSRRDASSALPPGACSMKQCCAELRRALKDGKEGKRCGCDRPEVAVALGCREEALDDGEHDDGEEEDP